MSCIRVTASKPFPEALAVFLGLIPHHNQYEFDETNYLIAKNVIDAKSYNPTVSEKLKKIVADRISFKSNTSENKTFVVVDIGAGLMPLLHRINEFVASNSSSRPVLKYIAFESNSNLLPSIEQLLLSSSSSSPLPKFDKVNDDNNNTSTYVR